MIPAPTNIKRWRLKLDPDVRLNAEVNAQRDHVSVEVIEYGYSEESRLGVSRGGKPAELRKVAAAFRDLADTIEAACAAAEAT